MKSTPWENRVGGLLLEAATQRWWGQGPWGLFVSKVTGLGELAAKPPYPLPRVEGSCTGSPFDSSLFLTTHKQSGTKSGPFSS